jgi:hypothetical protein
MMRQHDYFMEEAGTMVYPATWVKFIEGAASDPVKHYCNEGSKDVRQKLAAQMELTLTFADVWYFLKHVQANGAAVATELMALDSQIALKYPNNTNGCKALIKAMQKKAGQLKPFSKSYSRMQARTGEAAAGQMAQMAYVVKRPILHSLSTAELHSLSTQREDHDMSKNSV